jgi:antitoxin component YwqK of YwqJK toxin-antitoxin module
MKKISAFILAIAFLVIAGECLARTTSVTEESDGLTYIPNETTPFTGTVETKFPNGQKKTEAIYVDGKLNGLKTIWFESGQKQSELNYKEGKLNGLLTAWFENGKTGVDTRNGI